MNKIAKLFYGIGEPFAAGFFEEETDSPAVKFCRAYRRFYENCPLPEYKSDDCLYPYGKFFCHDYAVNPNYCRQYEVNTEKLVQKSPKAAEYFNEFQRKHGSFLDVEGAADAAKYSVYLDGWNHAALNFKRIVSEGLDLYEKRVNAMKDATLSCALLDVLAGIRSFHTRSVEYLESVNAEKRLIDALKKVPFSPAAKKVSDGKAWYKEEQP